MGSVNGVAARFKKFNAKIIIMHCIAHRLSLDLSYSNHEIEPQDLFEPEIDAHRPYLKILHQVFGRTSHQKQKVLL